MDVTVFFGIIVGFFLMAFAIGLDPAIQMFYHPQALLIVLGGTFGAAFINFPFTELKLIGTRLSVIFKTNSVDYYKDISFLVRVSQKVRKESKASIIKDIEKIKDHFIRTSLQLYVDGVPIVELESVMNQNLKLIEDRHRRGIHFFEQLAKYAPAFGLLGTVIGLIKLLSSLESPEAVGPGMAIALVTTFYGILFSNLFFLPISGRLRTFSHQEIIEKEMLKEGILSLARNETPIIIKERMMLFLSEKERSFVT